MELSGAAPDVREAIERSSVGHLPPECIATLLTAAKSAHVASGSTIRPAGEPGPHVELVVSGLVRLFLSAPDGRTLTVRYCRSGALIGVGSLFRTDFVLPLSSQALVDSEILHLRPDAVRDLASRDVRVARALIDELSDRIVSFIAEIPGSAFASVRQRVARHLLDLAAEQQHGTALVAHGSQQHLADAVGSVREVVVRTLRDLRRDGIVETGRDRITILRPEALAMEVSDLAIPPSATTPRNLSH